MFYLAKGEINMNVQNKHEFKSQLINCILDPREQDGDLFFIDGDNVYCDLVGYAIIPCEKYEEMKAKITQLDMGTKNT